LSPTFNWKIHLFRTSRVPTPRSITDKALSAFEVLNFMRGKHKGKTAGEVALKLDVSKAFDSVNWKYLRVVMKRIEFCDR